MANNVLEEGWHWVEKHPWIAAGGVAAIGIVGVLLFMGGSSGSTNPGQTFAQQYKYQKLLGDQQLAAIRAQELPSIVQSRSAEGASNVQSRTAMQTAIGTARIGAASQDLQSRLGLQATEAGYANNLKLALVQQQNEQAQLQSQDYIAELQQFIAALEADWAAGTPSGGGVQIPLPTPFHFPTIH